MNLKLDPHAELRSLVEAVCEETITAPEMERLEALVAADPDAEAFYITYLHMQACLVREFGTATPEFGEDSQGPPESLDDEGVERMPVRVPAARTLHFRLGYAAAAFALAVTVGLAGVWVGRLTGARPDREPAPPVAGAPYPKVDFARGLAMVVKLDRVEWEPEDGPRPAEGDLLPAGRFRFRSGRATLSMLTGVTLVVEGPADLEFLSFEKVFCHRGKLRARVPDGAEGFVVSGSGSAVVDLGTEFGMNVELDGTMRGRVFEGRVEAAVLNESGTIQRSRMMRTRSNVFAIDPRNGQIEAGPGPEQFVAPSDVVVPPLTLDPGYKSAVLTSRPWAYWRFDAIADGTVANEIPGRPPLLVTGPIHLSGSAGGNRSAVFGAEKSMQYLSMERPWKAARRPGYAVELWFLSEVIGHAALVSMTVPANTNFHQFLLEMTSKDRGSLLHQPASIRFLHRCPPGTGGGDNLYSHNLYVPFRWHHVVGQMNGDRMELFMDGEPTPPLSVDPDDIDQPGQFLLGRLTAVEKYDQTWNRPLVGQMDEVALYDRPLSIGEIRGHYRLGARASRPD